MGNVFLVSSQSTGENFAAKRIKGISDRNARFMFFRELWTWIDLPEHPHLVACRFMRVVGDEIAIFSEFVEGGSIDSPSKTTAGVQLEQLLDEAIQLAWGIDALHQCGIVHQDVKPANALVDRNGRVKLNDYGLARARLSSSIAQQDIGQLASAVTAAGGTPAYCSPEQADRKPLTPQTDIWSWGVTVLQLFNGEVGWLAGPAAPYFLEQEYLRRGPARPHLPPMPSVVVDVLRTCFQPEPSERWGKMNEVAKVLQQCYRTISGSAYPRPHPGLVRLPPKLSPHDRSTNLGVEWDDPREFLEIAFAAEGRDPSEVREFLPLRTGSRRAQVYKDLAVYVEAVDSLTKVVEGGQSQFLENLAHALHEKAFVDREVDDLLGALRTYNTAIELQKQLAEGGEVEATADLARAYLNKGIVLYELGELQAAINVYDEAIGILKGCIYSEGHWPLAEDLAKTYVNKANVLDDLGYINAAEEFYHQATLLREWLVLAKGKHELLPELAATIHNHAIVAQRTDARRSVPLFDRVVGFLRYLPDNTQTRYLEGTAYLNRAVALTELGMLPEALESTDRAIEVFTHVVYDEGQEERRPELASALVNKAYVLLQSGMSDEALPFVQEGLGVLELLVAQEHRLDLQPRLEIARNIHAQLLARR